MHGPARLVAFGSTPRGHRHNAMIEYTSKLLYLRNPSTIRARVLDEFSAAPPIARIERMLRQRDTAERRRQLIHGVGEPGAFDGLDYAPRAQSHLERTQSLRHRQEVAERVSGVIAATALRDDGPIDETPDYRKRCHHYVFPADLIAGVERRFDLDAGTLLTSQRTRRISSVRGLATVVLRARGNTFPECARRLNMDHSSAIHLTRRFFDHAARDPDLIRAFADLAPCVIGAARTYDEFHAMAPNWATRK